MTPLHTAQGREYRYVSWPGEVPPMILNQVLPCDASNRSIQPVLVPLTVNELQSNTSNRPHIAVATGTRGSTSYTNCSRLHDPFLRDISRRLHTQAASPHVSTPLRGHKHSITSSRTLGFLLTRPFDVAAAPGTPTTSGGPSSEFWPHLVPASPRPGTNRSSAKRAWQVLPASTLWIETCPEGAGVRGGRGAERIRFTWQHALLQQGVLLHV